MNENEITEEHPFVLKPTAGLCNRRRCIYIIRCNYWGWMLYRCSFSCNKRFTTISYLCRTSM